MKKIGREVLFLDVKEGNPRNGEGTFIRLKDGSILFVYSMFSGNDWYDECSADIAALTSYDDGETWSEIAERQDIPFPDKSETGLQETMVYQHSDGFLHAYSRTDMAFQYECFSYDNGETWTDPSPNRFFSSPDSPLLMKRIGEFTLAVFNPIPNYTTRPNADGNMWGRTPLVCAVSEDDGKTFNRIYALENDPNNGYCYPAIIEGEDYFLVAYYHSNNNECPLTCCKMIKVMYDEIR